MVAPRFPEKLSMTGGSRHKEVDGCDEGADFDTFCEATQNLFCRVEVIEGEKPQDPDSLDYVFEHVESVVCKEGADEDDDPNPINLANSFVDYEDDYVDDPESRSDIPRIIETIYASSDYDSSDEDVSEIAQASEMPAPVVQKDAVYQPDLLDYVFEKVESLICQEDAPDEHYMEKYGPGAGMERDNSLIEAPISVSRYTARQLDKLERDRVSDDETVIEVLYEEGGVEMEDKTATKKKRSLFKKLACVLPIH
jgi:hypothetical protein